MNYASRKTTLNNRKMNYIIISIVINLFLCILIVCQNEDILENQQIILENQSNVITAINNSTTYVLKMIDDINTTKAETIEDISAESGSETIKSKMYNIDNNYTNIMSVPNCDTSFKTYMDYRTITDITSAQYMLQMEAYTDDMGLRKYEDHYIVAMGTYYSDNVGDTFKITLDNDTSFNVIIGDIKADCHTDSKNMYSPVYDEDGNFVSANVIEFIVDTKKLDRSVKKLGTIEVYDDFKGNIVKIERTDVYE